MAINENYQVDAHYSSNMKIQRPSVVEALPPTNALNSGMFSDKDATKRFNSLNNDIYEGTNKEKKNHVFNRKRFIKIFIGVLLAVAGIFCFGKIRNFFKK